MPALSALMADASRSGSLLRWGAAVVSDHCAVDTAARRISGVGRPLHGAISLSAWGCGFSCTTGGEGGRQQGIRNGYL